MQVIRNKCTNPLISPNGATNNNNVNNKNRNISFSLVYVCYDVVVNVDS